tara:strand:- start:1231 stop:1809 length:579 start_codon:yes stop_codon:yes gene_type:complete
MDNQTLEYLNHLISQYGYIILILFTFLEGETIVIVAGVFVHSGALKFPLVVIASCLGAFIGDQFYFFLGRKYGTKILNKKPNLALKAQKITNIIDRYETLLIISFRFLYGLRTVTPIALGLSKVSYIKFLILNLIGSIIWALIFSYIGYLIAQSVIKLLGYVEYYQFIASFFIIIFTIILFVIYKVRKKSAK